MGKTSLVEKIEFFWYVRRISFLALIGYIGGAAAYVLLHYISSSRDPKLI